MEVRVGQKGWSVIPEMMCIAPCKEELIQKVRGNAVYAAPADGGDARRFTAEGNHFSCKGKAETLLFLKKQDLLDWMEDQIRGRYERMCRLSKGKLRKMDLQVLEAMKEALEEVKNLPE